MICPLSGGTCESSACVGACRHRLDQKIFMDPYKGWTCPKCGSVYSPNVAECKRCNKSEQRDCTDA